MSNCGILSSALLLTLSVTSVGCAQRPRTNAKTEPVAVGWTMPPASPVARGALISTPPGHEEPFIPVVANHVDAWARACQAERGSATQAAFTLEIDAAGHAILPPRAAEDRLAGCFASRAVETLATENVPRQVQLRIALELRTTP